MTDDTLDDVDVTILDELRALLEIIEIGRASCRERV